MRKEKLIITFFFLLVLQMVYGQNSKINRGDTLIVISPTFKQIKSMGYTWVSMKKDTVFVRKAKKIEDYDVVEDSLERLLSKGFYCVFYDKKGRKIEQGLWDHENITGNYILYFKNGKIKERGELFGSQKVGKWFYYKSNGMLLREEILDDPRNKK